MVSERQWLNVVIFVTTVMIILILAVHKHIVEKQSRAASAVVVLWQADKVLNAWLDGEPLAPQAVEHWLNFLAMPQTPDLAESMDSNKTKHTLEVRGAQRYVRIGIDIIGEDLVLEFPQKSLRYYFNVRQNTRLIPNWLTQQ